MYRLTCWVSLFLLSLTFFSVASAQNASNATLVGTVTDATGAVVPAVKVRVINAATQFVTEATTTAEGSYYLPYLAAGDYKLTIEAPGFKTYTQEGIVLRAAEQPRIDIVLQVGSQTEQVTITGAAPLLQTETAASGTTYTGETITRIPVQAKRTMRALYFFPNTIGDRIMGQRQDALAYNLDGISAKAPGLANVNETDATVQTAPEAYQEVKVYTTGMPAEIGHASGGMMSMVYKSGANTLHGSTEIRFQNQPMLHRAWLQQLPTQVPYYYGEYTGALSGPVKIPKLYDGHNKTFFLMDYTLQDEHFNANVTTTVPTVAMLNGDFSFPGAAGGPIPIYNPLTTRQNADGSYTRDPFAGNIIPKNLFDPVVANFLSHNPWRAPNTTGDITRTGPSNNLLTVTDRTKLTHRHRMDYKLDQQFGANNRFYVRVSPTIHHADRDNPDMRLTFDGDGKTIDSRQQPFPLQFWNFLASDVQVLSPTMTNEIRFGGNHRKQNNLVLASNEGWAQKLGMPNVSPVGFPYFNAGYGLSPLPANHTGGDDFVLQDNVTKVLGKNTIKFGWEVTRTWYNATNADYPSGQYSFGGTEQPFCSGSTCSNTPNTGITFASFLLGTVSSAQFTQSFASWLPRWWSHQGYIQTDWRPFKSVTVNLGMRWSYESPFQTKYGQQAEFSPTVTDTLTGRMGAIVHNPGGLANLDRNNFEPRAGLAWNFRPKMVFRGSFGLVHSDVFMNNTELINFQEYQGVANVQAPTGNPNPIFRLSQGPPAVKFAVGADGVAPYVGTNYSARNADWFDPAMRMPYVMSWSAGVQYELKRDYLIEVQYMGQGGVGLINGRNINQIPLSIYQSASPATLNTIASAQQNYLPYPQFGTVRLWSNFGHNTYHSGNLRFERRYSSGLALSAFYTFQKTLNDADGGGSASAVDVYNLSLEKGPAGYSIKHRFIGLLQYSLPFGKGQRFLNHGGIANAILGGWNVTWSQTLQSGSTYSVTYSGSPNKQLTGGGTSRPNIIVPTMAAATTPDWKGVGANRFPFSAQVPSLIDTAFAYPAAYSIGNLGRNTFTGPNMNWPVTSLTKWFQLSERFRAQVGIDGINQPFKHPNFNNPSSTWNLTGNQNFGRITGYTVFNNAGASQANWQMRMRVEW